MGRRICIYRQRRKPLCLICHDSLSHYKASNMKRHHETRHSNFSNNYPLKSALRRSKLTELKSLLNFQQTLIKRLTRKVIQQLKPALLYHGISHGLNIHILMVNSLRKILPRLLQCWILTTENCNG